MASSTARSKFPIQLSVSLSAGIADEVETIAEEEGVSKSEVARDLILAGLDARRQEEDAAAVRA